MSIPPWLHITLQVVTAIILIIILYIITLAVLSIDSLLANKDDKMNIKQKNNVVIIDGFAGPSILKQIDVNSVNPYTSNFLPIQPSANEKGGISFTWQMWIKVEQPDDNLFKNLILLIKGENQQFNVTYYQKNSSDSNYSKKAQLSPDYYIACPSIGFGNSYRQLKVRFNSNKDIVNEININMDTQDPISKRNILSLLPVNWTLLTFVFEDNYSFTEQTENGIKFTLYVNDIAYWQETASSVPDFRNDFLKWNDGNVYLLPNVSNTSEFLKLGNIKYYNYAIDSNTVKSTYYSGPPKHMAVNLTSKDKVYRPAYISALNKIDVYNY